MPLDFSVPTRSRREKLPFQLYHVPEDVTSDIYLLKQTGMVHKSTRHGIKNETGGDTLAANFAESVLSLFSAMVTKTASMGSTLNLLVNTVCGTCVYHIHVFTGRWRCIRAAWD